MSSPRLAIGPVAPDFNLPSVDGRHYSLNDFDDKKVLVVLFTCNHCPYVQAYEPRLISIQNDFRDRFVSLVTINSNEIKNHPEDKYEEMVIRSKEIGFKR